MPISAGVRLGRYEILSQLGAGGMGEVYLALDTELDRTVAIKILPEALTSDPQRLQRFIQEAKAASALNHPHILTIYEIGDTGASRFIVTEFIDGETLRQRISVGIRLVEILEISIQAGSALAAAHAAGIVHRDIKPESKPLLSLEPNIALATTWRSSVRYSSQPVNQSRLDGREESILM